jgi:hypothetical protein
MTFFANLPFADLNCATSVRESEKRLVSEHENDADAQRRIMMAIM